MSPMAALIIAVLVLSVIVAILLFMVIKAVNEIQFLRDDLAQIQDTEHVKCLGAVMAYVGNQWAAQILDVAADDYASVEADADKDRIGRLLWREDGDPIPSIWMRERADRLRIMAEGDVTSIIEQVKGMVEA